MKTIEECRALFQADLFATKLCGIEIIEVGDGAATCRMLLAAEHMNANGVAQGGAIYTLCDTAFAVAANAGGTLTVSTSASISYVRPGTGKSLTATATLISEGRTTCLYEVRVIDCAGKLVVCAMINGAKTDKAI